MKNDNAEWRTQIYVKAMIIAHKLVDVLCYIINFVQKPQLLINQRKKINHYLMPEI